MIISEKNSQITEAFIQDVTNEPETKFLERKGAKVKHSKLANELIGMLNSGGGLLIYGVADDGAVECLEANVQDLNPYRKLVHELIKPPAAIDLEEVRLSTNELVFLYHVEPSYEGVYKRSDNEAVYLRIADDNKGPLNHDEISKLEYNRGSRNYEEEFQEDFEEESLDEGLCKQYLKAMNFKGSFQELASKRRLLKKQGSNYLYRKAAVLLFAENPEDYIRNAHVRYVRFEGVTQKSGDMFNAVKDERFEGAIPRLIGEVSRFLEASFRDYYFLNLELGRFVKVPEYPKDAWLEALVNALYHRSYNIQGQPILIKHYEDRLEISNSGPLPAQVTEENIQDQQYTRNVRIARVLHDMGYVKELNEGVKRIYRVMEELHLESPEYRQKDGYVYITLKNSVARHKKTISKEVMERIEGLLSQRPSPTSFKIINHLLFSQPEATIDQFIEVLPTSESTIRDNLRYLERLDIIEKSPLKKRDRNAVYKFKA